MQVTGTLSGVTPAAGGAVVASYVYGADGSLFSQTDGSRTTVYLPGEQLSIDTSTTAPTLSGVRFYALPGGVTAMRTGGGPGPVAALDEALGLFNAGADWLDQETGINSALACAEGPSVGGCEQAAGNVAMGVVAIGTDGAGELADAALTATKDAGGAGSAEMTPRFITNSAGTHWIPLESRSPEGKFGYLLENPSKAGVFSDSMGFDKETLGPALRNRLTDNFGDATPSEPMVGGGSKFSVMSPISGPSGETWNITSVWGVDLNGTVRLITATP